MSKSLSDQGVWVTSSHLTDVPLVFQERKEENGAEKNTLKQHRDFPGGAVVKNLPVNAGDMGLSPGPGRSHMLQSN